MQAADMLLNRTSEFLKNDTGMAKALSLHSQVMPVPKTLSRSNIEANGKPMMVEEGPSVQIQ